MNTLTFAVLIHDTDILGAALLPLANEEANTKVVGRKGNLRALGEVKNVALLRLDLVASLVADVKVAVDDELDLVVRVLVDKRSAFLEAVDAARDGRYFVILLAASMSLAVLSQTQAVGGQKATNLETMSPRKAFSLAMRGGLNSDWALGKCWRARGAIVKIGGFEGVAS